MVTGEGSSLKPQDSGLKSQVSSLKVQTFDRQGAKTQRRKGAKTQREFDLRSHVFNCLGLIRPQGVNLELAVKLFLCVLAPWRLGGEMFET